MLDMAGNVWEWTNSIDKPYPYKADDGREDPDDTGSRRVIRGGGWFNSGVSDSRGCRSAYRCPVRPPDCYLALGVRLCVVVGAPR